MLFIYSLRKKKLRLKLFILLNQIYSLFEWKTYGKKMVHYGNVTEYSFCFNCKAGYGKTLYKLLMSANIQKGRNVLGI